LRSSLGEIFQRDEESDLEVISKSNTARRSQQRKKRQEKIRIHELNKPCLEEENAQDLAAIELAKNTIGDLKLKSDPDFVISNVLTYSQSSGVCCCCCRILMTHQRRNDSRLQN